MAGTCPAMTPRLESDLTQIDAFAELGVDCSLLTALGDLDHVGAGVLLELVELEVAVVVARCLRHHLAALQELYAGSLNTVDDAVGFGRDAAADEAGGIAPEIAVVDPRLGAELGSFHFEALLARHAHHLV